MNYIDTSTIEKIVDALNSLKDSGDFEGYANDEAAEEICSLKNRNGHLQNQMEKLRKQLAEAESKPTTIVNSPSYIETLKYKREAEAANSKVWFYEGILKEMEDKGVDVPLYVALANNGV